MITSYSEVKLRPDHLKKAIFKLLYYNGALSVAELSMHTNKSVPNITSVMSGLPNDGYAIEHGLAQSTGGRRAVTYRLNKQVKMYFIAVAMDQIITRIVVYNRYQEQRVGKE